MPQTPTPDLAEMLAVVNAGAFEASLARLHDMLDDDRHSRLDELLSSPSFAAVDAAP